MPMDDRRVEKRFTDSREKQQQIRAGLPGAEEEPLPPPVKPIHTDTNVGRNDPCPCGSGKKYKKCCAKKK